MHMSSSNEEKIYEATKEREILISQFNLFQYLERAQAVISQRLIYEIIRTLLKLNRKERKKNAIK